MTAVPNLQSTMQQAVQAATAGAGASTLSAGVTSPAYSTPFADVLEASVQKTQQMETDAANTVMGLLSGQGVDVHTAMIATEKANLGFEMMLAFRNKAVAAYQQLMGLQF